MNLCFLKTQAKGQPKQFYYVKRGAKLIEFDGEKYVTVSEVVQRLQISYGTCKNNVLPLLAEYYLPGRRRAVYKLSDVEQLSQVRIVERQVQSLTLARQGYEAVHIEDSLCREIL